MKEFEVGDTVIHGNGLMSDITKVTQDVIWVDRIMVTDFGTYQWVYKNGRMLGGTDDPWDVVRNIGKNYVDVNMHIQSIK